MQIISGALPAPRDKIALLCAISIVVEENFPSVKPKRSQLSQQLPLQQYQSQFLDGRPAYGGPVGQCLCAWNN